MPPDRGTILGRAVWKTRYVVIGSAQKEPQSPLVPIGPPQINRNSTPIALRRAFPEGVFLSIYKNKDDAEPVQQHAIATIQDCQVQMMAHRKQGPVLPTLVVNIVPDPATDKLRKRRSSRTAGLTATKETSPTTLFFRSAPESHALHDWAHVVHQFIQSHVPERTPLSPITPASPSFINPFAPRPRDASESLNRPGSGNPSSRPPFFSKGSNHTGSSRERPVTYSETHSLRSKPSDLSSHTSSMNPSHMMFHQNFTTVHPTDLPSPATTIGDYQGEFIEGWTSAQGRSSTISSPVRIRDSFGSQIPSQSQSMIQSSSPPLPRETILDRAFQLRYIPGSERETPGEEKLSSLARFDALMREADEKRKEREAREAREAHEARARAATITPMTTPSTTDTSGLKSAWDLDDDSDDDDDDDEGFDEEYDDNIVPSDGMARLDLEDRFRDASNPQMPPSTQLALEYIANGTRRQALPSPRSPPPLSYNQETLIALSNSGSSRPQTGYSKNRRPAMAQRTHSQPQLAGLITSSSLASPVGPSASALAVRRDISAPTSAKPFDNAGPVSTLQAHLTTENRLSASSAKRQSFSEFTKRLSSTSSLLLFPSNGSSRSDTSDMQQQSQQQQPQYLYPRAAPAPPPQQPQSPPPEKCSWRGSVGVFGADPGFL